MRELLKSVLFIGLPLSLLGMLGMAAAVTAIDLPAGLLPILAALPLLLGAFCAALPAGRRLRRHGLRLGAACGAMLTAIWYLAACMLLHRLRLPLLCMLTLPAGMCGGVVGVNCAPIPLHRRQHLTNRAKKSLILKLELCRKPKNQKSPKNA